MKKSQRSEKGQVMVLLVVGIVVLMGFTALAIDGGMVYSDRRYDQSAADAAALAAISSAIQTMEDNDIIYSNFNCSSMNSVKNNAISSGISRAQSNLITIDKNLSDGNGIEVICQDNDTSKGFKDKYLDVHVRITTSVDTAFAHLLFGGPLQNTVDVTTRARPSGPALAGYALYALDPNCSENGINLSGTVDVHIYNGSAFSRSCIGGNGNTSLTAHNGTVHCLRNGANPGWCDPSDAHFTPRMSGIDIDPWNVDIPIPDCSNRTIAPARTVSGTTLEPGYYVDLPGHQELKLKPGLYCISGSVKLNGGGNITSIAANGYDGVTVVFMNGDYEAKGNGGMDLKAAMPGSISTQAPGVVPGVALIFAKGNTNSLDLGGNSINKFRGTVYVPDGSIAVGGTGDVPTSTQFIAFNFWSHGNSQTNINYNGDVFFQGPPKFEMLK